MSFAMLATNSGQKYVIFYSRNVNLGETLLQNAGHTYQKNQVQGIMQTCISFEEGVAEISRPTRHKG